jgi:protein TonB
MPKLTSFCYLPHTGFTSRNRQYGAYTLRQSYAQHLWKGFLLGTLFVSFVLVDWVLYENMQAGKTKIIAQEKNTPKTVVKEPSIDFNFIPPPPEAPKNIHINVFLYPPLPDGCYNDGYYNYEDDSPIQNVTKEESSELVLEPLQQPLPVVIEKEEATPTCTLPYILQQNAQFVGGHEAMFDFLHKHINMPAKVRKKKVKGRVYVRFLVTKTGKITDINLLKGIENCPQCDREALRLVKLMPDWKPAEQAGKPIETHFTLPIIFDYDSYQKRRQE